MEDNNSRKQHELNIVSRQKLTATGVSRIRFFSEDTVAAESVNGLIVVKGEGLFVESLDSSSGVLLIKGKVNSVAYGEFRDGKSFIKRLFK